VTYSWYKKNALAIDYLGGTTVENLNALEGNLNSNCHLTMRRYGNVIYDIPSGILSQLRDINFLDEPDAEALKNLEVHTKLSGDPVIKVNT
jgi:hypothetical protein